MVHAIHSKTENYLMKTEIFTPDNLFHLLSSLSDMSKKPFQMLQIIFMVISVLQKSFNFSLFTFCQMKTYLMAESTMNHSL
jgi:hypothetical protein